MADYALDLNDAELIAIDAGGERLRSAGVAAFADSAWSFGAQAARIARTSPQQVSSTHFAALGSLVPSDLNLRPAEIAYQQLLDWAKIFGTAPGMWLVSAVWNADDLGLLLGIAEAAGLDVASLLDRAVAAAACLPFEGRVLCVDVELERGVITEVHNKADRSARHRSVVVPEMGLRSLNNDWTNGFAARMVQQTRFDPLHVAASEQMLFDAMPDWLDRLARGEVIESAQISSGDAQYAIPFRAAEARGDAAAAYGALVAKLHAQRNANEPAAILVSDLAVRLPGLIAALDEFHDCDIFTLALAQAARQALALSQQTDIDWPPGSLVLNLPRSASSDWTPLRAATALTDPSAAATHVLYEGRATALSTQALIIGSAPVGERVLELAANAGGISRAHCSVSLDSGHAFVLDHSRYGTFVNGERVLRRALLRAGDRLRLGNPGVELAFVRMS